MKEVQKLGFLSTSKRDLTKVDSEVNEGQPLMHSPQEKAKTPSKHNRAPFNSSNKRTLASGRDLSMNPGPGEYYVPSSIDRNSSTKASFHSKLVRFPKDKKSSNPGPGDYRILTAFDEVNRKAKKAKQRNASLLSPEPTIQVEWEKKPSVPSIPSHERVYGYEENEKTGELVEQRPKTAGYSGTKHDTVGPGDYNPDYTAISSHHPSSFFGRGGERTFSTDPPSFIVQREANRDPFSEPASFSSFSSATKKELRRRKDASGKESEYEFGTAAFRMSGSRDIIPPNTKDQPAPADYILPSTLNIEKKVKGRKNAFGSKEKRFFIPSSSVDHIKSAPAPYIPPSDFDKEKQKAHRREQTLKFIADRKRDQRLLQQEIASEDMRDDDDSISLGSVDSLEDGVRENGIGIISTNPTRNQSEVEGFGSSSSRFMASRAQTARESRTRGYRERKPVSQGRERDPSYFHGGNTGKGTFGSMASRFQESDFEYRKKEAILTNKLNEFLSLEFKDSLEESASNDQRSYSHQGHRMNKKNKSKKGGGRIVKGIASFSRRGDRPGQSEPSPSSQGPISLEPPHVSLDASKRITFQPSEFKEVVGKEEREKEAEKEKQRKEKKRYETLNRVRGTPSMGYSKGKRFKYDDELKGFNVGPGQYSIPSSMTELTRKAQRERSMKEMGSKQENLPFISSSFRMQPTTAQDLPGPGYYYQNSDSSLLTKTFNMNMAEEMMRRRRKLNR